MVDVFIAPGRIVSGVDVFGGAVDAIWELDEKTLIVTDGMMCKPGNFDRLTNILEASGIRYAVEDKINGEPDDGMIPHGLSVYQRENCDFLTALGGGSPIDSMEAIVMLAVCGGRSADYMEKAVIRKLRPIVVVLITVGTGSEATQLTIITDRATQVRVLLKGPSLMPDLAAIDPAFTVTALKSVTAVTGVDVLTHAIEAYTSRETQPLLDTFTSSVCQRILASLRKVWEDGQDKGGRTQMSLVALEAGMAFSSVSVMVVHGMSRPIGAMFHAPYGISNVMLLNACPEYVPDGAVEWFVGLMRVCRLADAGNSDGEAAQTLVDAAQRLLREIETPTSAEYGIAREEFLAAVPKTARDAAASGSPASTRKEITVEVMEELYKKLW